MPKPTIGILSLRRFFKALDGLKADPELRARYFDDATAIVEVEFWDRRWTWPTGAEPSLHYLESKADKVVRETRQSFVVPTVDYSCSQRDAARHVAGLKKGVIVLPEDPKELEAWCKDYRGFWDWMDEFAHSEGTINLSPNSRWRR